VFCQPGFRQKAIEEVESRFYIRCSVSDISSAFNEITAALNAQGVQVDMAERIEMQGMKVVALTEKLSRRGVARALEALAQVACVMDSPYAIPVEEVGE